MTNKNVIPLLGITAYSGTGKTTLLKKVIPFLAKKNILVGIIKHTDHDMDIDKPNKDSYQLRQAGAKQTLIACQQRWALMTETSNNTALDLAYLANQFDPQQTDLILVEGFKEESIPKIALYRANSNRPFLDIMDQHLMAVASDDKQATQLLQLDINSPEQIADYIANWLTDK
ncbi:molybdopterin-guanine dinucleotide biosynthesis protein B [Arsenophonus sp. ENCA]|uniref:molybdopterin-guanine dinucleotide biosynthesis protein MobB n=1 Tax=Arsenophonus sp. ENCA TaxID=1987579 RepID=UPI000BC51580|nr:molybdopterin-guanine dinucleotide biosynthesis protein MobB [Arsenophonus sp. ENCA]PAV01567.1 molybdopterin-guanine dinucleotide biosynthesis protein B [Arsenophonus sp. ENCA]